VQLSLVGMSPAFYRREANRYRLLAADAGRAQAEHFRRVAAECDGLANELERGARRGQTSDIALSKRRFLAWPLLPGGSR